MVQIDNTKMWATILYYLEDYTGATVSLSSIIKQALKDQGFKWDGEHIVPIKDTDGQTSVQKPKFKVGDWVILTAGELSITLQIVKVDTNKKLYWFNDSSYLPIVDEECLHFWTIKDAKGGDVLVNDFHLIFILKEIKNNTFVSHCSVIEMGNDVITNSIAEREVGYSELVKVYPATQEQRSKLFSKMAEEGYEWDADKLELKKIEQKPWSEEDEKMFNTIANSLDRGLIERVWHTTIKEVIAWLKILKDRVQLQSQWKPSEEQMRVLALSFGGVYKEEDIQILRGLFEQLKAL